MKRLLPLLALLPAACSSPDPRYFTLAAVPGAPVSTLAHTIELRRVGLAAYLDRSNVVSSNGGYRLKIANNEEWGEPFGDMVGRVLAEELTQRLPGSTVFSEAGAIAAEPDATLEIDIQRFDAAPDGTVTLRAQVVASSNHSNSDKKPFASRPFRLTAPTSGRGTEAKVAVMSTLLAQLADQIAAMLQAAPPTASITGR